MIAIPLVVKTLAASVLSKVKDYAKNKLIGAADNAKNNPMMYAVPICIIALIAIIVIPNMSDIKEKFGIETTKSLSVKLAQEERNTDAVIKANKSLQIVQEHVKILDETEEKLTEALVNELNVANTRVNEVKDSSNKKIIKITKNTSLTSDEKEQKISEVNINSMWTSYCSFNQDDECKKVA